MATRRPPRGDGQNDSRGRRPTGPSHGAKAIRALARPEADGAVAWPQAGRPGEGTQATRAGPGPQAIRVVAPRHAPRHLGPRRACWKGSGHSGSRNCSPMPGSARTAGARS